MRTALLFVALSLISAGFLLLAAPASLTAQPAAEKTPLKTSNKRPSAADIRKAIERGLPFVETEGVGWLKERKCMSCHVVPYMVWAFNEARTSGVKVDEKKLAGWTDWCVNDSLTHRHWFKLTEPKSDPKGPKVEPMPLQATLKAILGKGFVTEKELLVELRKILTAKELQEHQAALVKRATMPLTGGQNDGGSPESIAQMLLGRFSDANTADGTSSTITISELNRMDELLLAGPEVLLKWQEPNGSWKAGGQLPGQNRPRSESNEVSTAWIVLALGSLDTPSTPVSKAIDTGLAFFRKTKPGKSNESLLMHLLIESRFGKPGAAEPFLKEVLARQNADGGWGWLTGAASDAFATGQALYALSVAGLKADTSPILRAQSYLLDTQSKDGDWVVPPQAVSDTKSEGRIRRLRPIYHFWGSAWAVIGLSRSLEAPRVLQGYRR